MSHFWGQVQTVVYSKAVVQLPRLQKRSKVPSLYFLNGLLPVPEFPPAAEARLLGDIAEAQVPVLDGLESIMVAARDRRDILVRLIEPGAALPTFVSYAEEIFAAYAREAALIADDAEDCRSTIESTLPWAVAFKVAPWQRYQVFDEDKYRKGRLNVREGDWFRLVIRAFQRLLQFPMALPKEILLSQIKHELLLPVLDLKSQRAITLKIRAVLQRQGPKHFAAAMQIRAGNLQRARPTPTKSESRNADVAPDQPSHQIPSGAPGFSMSAREPTLARMKRGPRPKTADHTKLARIVEPYGIAWKEDKNLRQICRKADKGKVFVPKTWHPVVTWKGSLQKYRDKVIKVIESRLKSIRQLPS